MINSQVPCQLCAFKLVLDNKRRIGQHRIDTEKFKLFAGCDLDLTALICELDLEMVVTYLM